MILHRKICMWLKSKGVPFEPGQFDVDNDGRAIKRWTETLGRRPTAEDLAPFDPQMEDMAGMVRLKRNIVLQATDWAMLPDAPIPPGQVTKWAVYRQALRDLTKQPTFPGRVTWPDPPS